MVECFGRARSHNRRGIVMIDDRSFGPEMGNEILAERLRQIRRELFGEGGVPELTRQLGLPSRTWEDYERGVRVPGEAILKLIDLTGVQPHWLLSGEGDPYRPRRPALRRSRF